MTDHTGIKALLDQARALDCYLQTDNIQITITQSVNRLWMHRDVEGNHCLPEFVKAVMLTCQNSTPYQRLRQIEDPIRLDLQSTHINRHLRPQQFDMREVIWSCQTALPDEPKLTILTGDFPSQECLEYFCKRLKDEQYLWENTRVRPSLKVDARMLSVEHAFEKLVDTRVQVDKRPVIYPLIIEDSGDLESICQQLIGAFPDSMAHHYVIVIKTNCAANQISHTQHLEWNDFQKLDIFHWLQPIFEMLKWPKSYILEWANIVMVQCNHKGILHPDLVYQHIQTVPDYLFDYPNPNDFIEEIKNL